MIIYLVTIDDSMMGTFLSHAFHTKKEAQNYINHRKKFKTGEEFDYEEIDLHDTANQAIAKDKLGDQ